MVMGSRLEKSFTKERIDHYLVLKQAKSKKNKFLCLERCGTVCGILGIIEDT